MKSSFTVAKNQFLDCTPAVRRNALMKMMRYRKKEIHGQLNVIDRISELSDDILHHIVSFLGTKEACRTCVLSKRWTSIWSTGLILDFKAEYFGIKNIGEFQPKFDVGNCTEALERFKEFIDTTMRQYSEKNLCVRKFVLEYPIVDSEMDEKIDEWLEILVHNRVEALSLSITTDDGPLLYVLPDVLFAAKSLSSIECCRVSMTYCCNLQLMSLQSLNLSRVDVDECILQDIIRSCPLRNLKLELCDGFQNILIPQCSNLEFLVVCESLPVDGTIAVDTSSLRILDCGDFGDDYTTWPFTHKLGSMKNLRELRIRGVEIENYVFEQLVVQLVSIEIMWFYNCILPEKIKVSSKTLKELSLDDHVHLIDVEIDAPELKTFSYTGNLELSSVISSHGDAYLHLEFLLNTRAFVKLRKLLSKVDRCKVLELVDHCSSLQVEFDQDQVSEIRDGMTPDIPELKVDMHYYYRPEPSQIAVLLDGLFWSCHPVILSLVIPFGYNDSIVKYFLEALEEKVTCWKHPLKRIEVEGTDSSSVLLTKELVLRLRLHWEKELLNHNLT